ncbi:hypothetical protein [Mesorhizobium sp.]|uniref:hypothetical protein n=1 Tax=Mesorhizobium sp. TaxID=1871066 RepID=UPI00257E68D3|nr:hypothetical protein [Mesorhizobium sp.]
MIDLEVLQAYSGGSPGVYPAAHGMTDAAAANNDALMEYRDPVALGRINVKIFNDLPICARKHRSAWTQKGGRSPEPFTAVRSPHAQMQFCADDARDGQRQQPGKEIAPIKAGFQETAGRATRSGARRRLRLCGDVEVADEMQMGLPRPSSRQGGFLGKIVVRHPHLPLCASRRRFPKNADWRQAYARTAFRTPSLYSARRESLHKA